MVNAYAFSIACQINRKIVCLSVRAAAHWCQCYKLFSFVADDKA
jgi:hypothetical protein